MMVLCVLCKSCGDYDEALEACNKLHSREMLKHPGYCEFKVPEEASP